MVLPLDTEPLLWNAAKINSTQKRKEVKQTGIVVFGILGFTLATRLNKNSLKASEKPNTEMYSQSCSD